MYFTLMFSVLGVYGLIQGEKFFLHESLPSSHVNSFDNFSFSSALVLSENAFLASTPNLKPVSLLLLFSDFHIYFIVDFFLPKVLTVLGGGRHNVLQTYKTFKVNIFYTIHSKIVPKPNIPLLTT